ncbi:hypothetical protein [Arthrobacter sp. R4-81]
MLISYLVAGTLIILVMWALGEMAAANPDSVKIAAGNSAAGLSKPKGSYRRLMVGEISTLATGYVQNL